MERTDELQSMKIKMISWFRLSLLRVDEPQMKQWTPVTMREEATAREVDMGTTI